MVAITDLTDIARNAADTFLTGDAVADVKLEPWTDSAGQDAIRVVVVLTDTGAKSVDGRSAVQFLVNLKDAFFEATEARMPTVEYLTREDAVAGDDPES